ncbi:MAG: DUF3849 domain-containing protein [Oscillospiraceae bacterium]|nr:DUF3849 domain-containing protein [Oscillospiraceae bacterium]
MNEFVPKIGVCAFSLEEAKQKSELEFWLYSRMANLQCKEALEQIPEPDLNTEQGQELLRNFGIDRLMWVTACTMAQAGENDFTRAVIPAGYPVREAQEWTLSDASGLTGFAEQLSQKHAELGLIGAEYCTGELGQEDASGRLLIVNPRVLEDSVKAPHFELFYATQAPADSYFIKGISLADGQEIEMKRSSFLGIGNEAMLPEWAADRLEQARNGTLQQMQPEETESIEVIAS